LEGFRELVEGLVDFVLGQLIPFVGGVVLGHGGYWRMIVLGGVVGQGGIFCGVERGLPWEVWGVE
jgi:hypothetical protein